MAAGLLMHTLMAERRRTERGEAVLEEAVAVLQEVATGKGLTAFAAGRAMARWQAKAKKSEGVGALGSEEEDLAGGASGAH
jgi:hypothetical protein